MSFSDEQMQQLIKLFDKKVNGNQKSFENKVVQTALMAVAGLFFVYAASFVTGLSKEVVDLDRRISAQIQTVKETQLQRTEVISNLQISISTLLQELREVKDEFSDFMREPRYSKLDAARDIEAAADQRDSNKRKIADLDEKNNEQDMRMIRLEGDVEALKREASNFNERM